MNVWQQQWQVVRQRITELAQQHGREAAEVQLLAVSKTFPASAVVAVAQLGQRDFGENYIQEGIDKMAQVAERLPQLSAELRWHCIGPIQSNKTRLVAEHFDWVHTLDRLKIAQRLSEQRPAHLPDLQVLLQVNLDGGPNKSGVAPSEVLALAQAVQALPRLCLRGLMSIPEPHDDPRVMLDLHRQLHQLRVDVGQALGAPMFNQLSMGMSADMAPAIEAGSTWVRVGTAIFGSRS